MGPKRSGKKGQSNGKKARDNEKTTSEKAVISSPQDNSDVLIVTKANGETVLIKDEGSSLAVKVMVLELFAFY